MSEELLKKEQKEEEEHEEKTENKDEKEPKEDENETNSYEEEYFGEEEGLSHDEHENKEWKLHIPDCPEKELKSATNPTIMTLEKLPTWAKEGPEIVESNPPEKFEPLYKPNTEINEKISFWMRGNSVKLECDAVVNAANSHLYPGGGICGVLHSAAGEAMERECSEIGYTPTGKCAVTLGYNLPAKYCIHTVGPIGEQPDKLQEAYESTLSCIDGKKIRSVGLCCISTGIYGYPIENATPIALKVVRKFLEDPNNREKTDRIIFVVFERRDVVVYDRMRHIYFPLDIEYKFEEEEKPEEENKTETPEEKKIEEEEKPQEQEEKADEEKKTEEEEKSTETQEEKTKTVTFDPAALPGASNHN
ncbi:Appr-1-p processing enzyme family protein [Trichomonas vaginalis G3]|uniref:Appr-1-p processing enzyme family protein n=1 Tax=Trichomonas vaginalis (strain ATCC PRA-98 / G3) TaxID=412133 RepID=A2FMC7_TRIV3|nr:ADP-D-ribose binding [Trichomonas vaginalis G3]EAX93944.1 Appr-1-p processing enzyme family protein [Trichomonas vaginalis G3]KAI5549063.1 ADP-D-ribose binding [Trichomonas vaginalis G3]|eukprot:XP_001306874.1 Appr-1-p processing enzyme family protein [Trichomonas vaginalis G3]